MHFPTWAKRHLGPTALIFLLLADAGAAPDPNHAKVDQLFAPWDRTNSPGAAIVVVRDGATVYQRGYGYANLEHAIPITPQTRFDVASVAKQFTGLAVAMLIGQGKISLADDVRKHLPEVPDFGKPITVEHLVRHSSGLRDWPETFLLSGLDFEGPIRFERILEMVRRQRELDFAPGERYRYSNTGYNLLAATVAKVTGKSFRAWSDSNLFQPLGMTRTQVCDDPAEVVPDLAESYEAGGPSGTKRRVTSQLAGLGSSSLFTSAEDMGKWLLNFDRARVGGRAAIDLMCQTGKLNNGEKLDYCFGVFADDYHGQKMFEHAGAWAGYRSFTLVIPERRLGVAVLANAADLDAHRQAIKIADIFLGLTQAAPSGPAAVPEPPPFRADPATWDAFLGTYRLGPGWLLTITREGDALMTQATRENKFKMTPTGTNTFRVEAYDNQPVEFIRQKSSAVTNLIYRGIHAPKLKLPELTPAHLAFYAGNYWSEELGAVRRVEIHDGKLATRQPSGEWQHLLPTGDDRFDADSGGWTLQFTRDESSAAPELKISGGRVRNIRFTRITLPPPGPLQP